MGWFYDILLSYPIQQIHPEITPRTITLGLNAEIALAVCEIIVVKYDFIEVTGCQFCDILDHLQMLRIAITKTFPTLALAAGEVVGDAS